MKPVRLVLLAAVLATATTAPAHAQFLDFEDAPAGVELIPNGYGGFNWNNFYTISRGYHPGSGYDNGMRGDRAAFNGFGDMALMSHGGTFNFYSAYIGSAWEDNNVVTVQGRLGGALIFSQAIVAHTSGSTLVNFNFTGIDELRFSSSADQFVIDDMDFSGDQAVPEPMSMILLGTGLAGIGLVGRRRRRISTAA